MRKKNFILYILSAAIMTMTGCEDGFLDRSVSTQRTYDDIISQGFGNLYSNGIASYSYLRQFTSYGQNAMLAGGSDEADLANKAALMQRFNTGGWNQFSNPDEVMAHYYRGIAQTHRFMKTSEDFKSILAIDTFSTGAMEIYLRNSDRIYKLRAENRFLRAYFYFELIKRYGGVPIIDQALDVNTISLPPRKSFDECVQYIVDELDAAIPDMVDHWVNYNIPNGALSVIGSGRGDAGGTDVSNLGRAEKVAAKALKLRVLLYAASPLHNPTNSVTKWEAAAAAGHDFMTDPDLVHWRVLFNNYPALFTMNNANHLTSRKGSNSGIIFTVPQTVGGFQSTIMEQWNYPAGITGGAKNVVSPSQNLVDAFEMQATGLPIDAPASGYNDANPYTGRDPRLKMIIGVNGDVFGKVVGGANYVIKSFIGGSDAPGVEGASTTGYYLKKMIRPDLDISTAAGTSKSFILMRYGEVLLNYAEAMNEAYGPDAKPTINGIPAVYSALEAVNLVRGRTGVAMPALLSLDQSQLRERLRNERRVELAFEEHRFFDVRRWKIAEQTENMPLMGMHIESLNAPTNTAFSYTKFKVEDRVFTAPKMYLHPIPEAQIIINSWTQNPGW
jgi:starch-binding outer membrane protein, SusD/RagB family